MLHCQLVIKHKIKTEAVSKPQFFQTSFYRAFATQPTPYLTVGSAANADIVVSGLLPCHTRFNFQNDTLVVVAQTDITLETRKDERRLAAGGIGKLPFTPSDTPPLCILAEWILDLGSGVTVQGCVYSESIYHQTADASRQADESVAAVVEPQVTGEPEVQTPAHAVSAASAVEKTDAGEPESPDGLDIHTNKIRSSALRHMYDTMEEIEAPKATVVQQRGVAVVRGQKPQRDARRAPIYRRLAIGGAVLLAISLPLFYCGLWFSFEGPVTVRTAQPTSQPVPLPQPATVRPVADRLLNRVQHKLLLPQPPSQRFINSLLKELYRYENAGAQSLSGDFYNLTARLYLYKIWLDREEQLFDSEVKEAWRHEMTDYWRLAQKAYAQTSQPPALCLPLMPWMPEKKLKPTAMFLRYGSAQEASRDIETMLAHSRR